MCNRTRKVLEFNSIYGCLRDVGKGKADFVALVWGMGDESAFC